LHQFCVVEIRKIEVIQPIEKYQEPYMRGSVRLLFIALAMMTSLNLFAETKTAKATFAGGCFWCMEEPFDRLPGVLSTISGYTGGRKNDPTYEEVSAGGTGHAEAVQITFDPQKVSYEKLLQVFWKNVDPTDSGGQFCDRGNQYRTGIFYHDEKQKALAEKTKKQAEDALKKQIVTPIVAASEFYTAEEYHQDFYKKSTLRYKTYRLGCGRDTRLRELWGGN
jgi:peptide-methionine (S)-S-oxide reductase